MFSWSEEAKKYFNILRTCLVTAPILNYPNFQKLFIVQTNASLFAVGAMLSQLENENKNVEHPVAYCSRTLNPHNKNYTVTEKEAWQLSTHVNNFEFTLMALDFL